MPYERVIMIAEREAFVNIMEALIRKCSAVNLLCLEPLQKACQGLRPKLLQLSQG